MSSTDVMIDQTVRLKFLAIDEATRAALREFRPILDKAIDPILAKIYHNIDQFSAAATIYARMGDYETIKQGQRRHFIDFLFTGAFSDEYFANVIRAAQARQKIGLEPRWYLGCYSVIMQGINEVAVRAYRWRPERLAFVLAAINRAMMLDIDLAISVYIQAGRDSAAALLGQHAETFERDVSGTVGAVASAATQMRATAHTMSATVDHATRQANEVRDAAQLASTSVQTVASATEELSASILEISQQVNQSSQVAQAAVAEAERTNALVQGLNEAAARISDVVRLITDIASQTNLLALNATIEAARAGDAGKGFAVVAGEVKTLANQTARATDEISQQIASVQSATRDAVEAIGTIGGTINRINEITATIAAAVEEQGAATQEISRSVQGAAEGTRTVSTIIVAVSDTVGQTGQAAQEVLTASDQLSERSVDLSRKVDAFVTNIRAA